MGLEVGIEGVTHAVVQERWERNAQESEYVADKASKEERTAAADGAESVEGAGAVGEIGGVPQPPGNRITPGEGEGGASDKLRTAMDRMEVGGDDMDKGEAVEADKDNMNTKGGGGGGGGWGRGCWHWKPQGS